MLHYDAKTGVVEGKPLPAPVEVSDRGVLIVDSSHAWVWGRAESPQRPYLASFDGEAWVEQEPAPCVAAITAFAVEPTGRRWLVCDSERQHRYVYGTLWTQRPGETWTAVELPEGAGVHRVLTRADGDVWITGDGIYRTKAAQEVLTVPSLDRIWNDMLEHADPIALGDSCRITTIVLSTPVDGDYAAERAAVKDAFRGVDDPPPFAYVGESSFRGQTRVIVHLAFGAAPGPRLRKALGDRFGDAYCFQPDLAPDAEFVELVENP